MQPENPSKFGKYQLIAKLGHGGMADVFLAVHEGLGGFRKLVVIKMLRQELADDPEFVTMFLDEARIASRLNHPNVVQTNEIGEVGSRYYIAMEYLDGQPLNRIARHARDNGGFPPLLHYAVLLDLLAGLHHAHELVDFDGGPLELVHRDVSPQNVFVTYDGQIKVVDFGIAKAIGRASAATSQGVIKGKIRYMAPEQALVADGDRRIDVFAVGIMLWDAAVGKRMWQGMSDLQILRCLCAGEIPRSPRAVQPDVPEEIDAICQRALAPLDERYATAQEMRLDLERYLASYGNRPSADEIGVFVSTLFADKRKEVRGMIEERLTELSRAPSQFDLADFGPTTASGASSQRLAGGAEVAPSSSEQTLSGSQEGENTHHLHAMTKGATAKPAGARRFTSVHGAIVAAVAVSLAVAAFALRRPVKPASDPTVSGAFTAEPHIGTDTGKPPPSSSTPELHTETDAGRHLEGAPASDASAPPATSTGATPQQVVRVSPSVKGPATTARPATTQSASPASTRTATPPHTTDDDLSTRH